LGQSLSGKPLTQKQVNRYMNSRQSGDTQQQAADKAGISVGTGRRIEKGERSDRQERHWRTREDPLAGVWESELVPLLEQEPGLTGITLWEYLDDKYPGIYPEMKGSDDTLIDGVYVQGELRSTDDMRDADDPRFALADARAESVNFVTEWGYQLPRGYWMSLQEAGIRAYNGGRTVIDGEEYERGANDVTVLNSVVRNTRTGVTLVHATGEKYVENTTVLGVEQGFSIGSGDIVDSYGDANVGPVLSFAYSSSRGTTADITILPTDGARNGWGALAFIGGSDHNITLRSSAGSVNQNLPIVVSGDKHSICHLNGALANQDNLTVRNTEINNLTNFPLVLNNLAEGTEGQSNGPVSGNTSENSVRQN